MAKHTKDGVLYTNETGIIAENTVYLPGVADEDIEAAADQYEKDKKAADDAAAKATDGSELKGPLPDDFPGRKALEDAGINTYAQVRKADVKEVAGIGDATAAKIAEALAK